MTAIVLDTETTGLNPWQDRIIELAIVAFASGETLFHSYFNPEIPLPMEIMEITNITNEMVVTAPHFVDEAPRIATIINKSHAVVGHNIWYDRRMLNAEFSRSEVLVKWPICICTKSVWDTNRPQDSRQLMDAYKRFVDKRGFEGAHGALADTRATRAVLLGQISHFELSGLTWDELDPKSKTRSDEMAAKERASVGGTNHILREDGKLIFNIGKHKGTECTAIPHRYWWWLLKQDFPKHVNTVVEYIMRNHPTPEELYEWAERI